MAARDMDCWWWVGCWSCEGRQEAGVQDHRGLTVLTSFVLGLRTHAFKSALVNMGSEARLAAELARI